MAQLLQFHPYALISPRPRHATFFIVDFDRRLRESLIRLSIIYLFHPLPTLRMMLSLDYSALRHAMNDAAYVVTLHHQDATVFIPENCGCSDVVWMVTKHFPKNPPRWC